MQQNLISQLNGSMPQQPTDISELMKMIPMASRGGDK
jgi:hypothetical protein